jgi:hypothetical protein
MRNIFRVLAVASAGIFLQGVCSAATVEYKKIFPVDITVLGFDVGTVTWRTRVQLIVPVTELEVGQTGEFTIRGNVSNDATGLSIGLRVATVFGEPTHQDCRRPLLFIPDLAEEIGRRDVDRLDRVGHEKLGNLERASFP